MAKDDIATIVNERDVLNLKPSSHSSFCNKIIQSHPDIIGSILLVEGKVLSASTKPEAILAKIKEARYPLLFGQWEIILSITKANIDLFRKVKHIKISYADCDLWIFSVKEYRITLVIEIKEPYDLMILVDRINKAISDFYL